MKLLIVNCGSVTTKLAIYKDGVSVASHCLYHTDKERHEMPGWPFSLEWVEQWLKDHKEGSLDAVVVPGWPMQESPAGVHSLRHDLLRTLDQSESVHPAVAGARAMAAYSEENQLPAYVVFAPIQLPQHALLSGCPLLSHTPVGHTLNARAQARIRAARLCKTLHQVRFVVAHLGGSISVIAYALGKITACNNSFDGDGPLAPARPGTLPVTALIQYCEQSNLNFSQIYRRLLLESGWIGYLGTADARTVEKRIEGGDKEAIFYARALAYQVGKQIGRAAATLEGFAHGVILTGGLAYSNPIVTWIQDYCQYLGATYVQPGDLEAQEMAAIVGSSLDSRDQT